MSFSNEWTEWHLTPRGWETGSERTDGPGVTFKENPADRVLTYRYQEEQTSPYAKMHKGGSKSWESDDKQAVEDLLKKFGPAPDSL